MDKKARQLISTDKEYSVSIALGSNGTCFELSYADSTSAFLLQQEDRPGWVDVEDIESES